MNFAHVLFAFWYLNQAFGAYTQYTDNEAGIIDFAKNPIEVLHSPGTFFYLPGTYLTLDAPLCALTSYSWTFLNLRDIEIFRFNFAQGNPQVPLPLIPILVLSSHLNLPLWKGTSNNRWCGILETIGEMIKVFRRNSFQSSLD